MIIDGKTHKLSFASTSRYANLLRIIKVECLQMFLLLRVQAIINTLLAKAKGKCMRFTLSARNFLHIRGHTTMHWLHGVRLWISNKYAALPIRVRILLTNTTVISLGRVSMIGRRECETYIRSSDLEPFPYHLPMPGYQQTEVLRCQRCHGRRSSSYHRGYREDPGAHPPIGICSRRNTKCAAVKANLESSRAPHHFWIHELPVD
jgi:hypothetical protein